jgi:hypothetical protein
MLHQTKTKYIYKSTVSHYSNELKYVLLKVKYRFGFVIRD